jgi:hypothetical protein
MEMPADVAPVKVIEIKGEALREENDFNSLD